MKTTFTHLLLALVILATGLVTTTGCSSNSLKRERKDLRQEMRRKAVREARREARQFRRQGYMVAPGSMPMEKMLEETWMKLLRRDDQNRLVFIDSDGNAVAETRSVADMQALELAKLNLAGQLETQIRSMVKVNLANSQLNAEEAASVTRVLQAAKNVIAVRLENVDPSFKIYRVLKNKNVEVNIKLLYDRERAMFQAKNSLRMKLEEELGEMHGQLDKIMGLE